VSAVPAVCFAARRDVFRQLDGLMPHLVSPRLSGAGYGVLARRAGSRVLVTPFASVALASEAALWPLTDEERLAWIEQRGPAGDDERYSLFDRHQESLVAEARWRHLVGVPEPASGSRAEANDQAVSTGRTIVADQFM